jgi:phosphate transport system substrate-binding protein
MHARPRHAAVLALAVFAGCHGAAPKGGGGSAKLRGAGGSALLPFVQASATEFRTRHPEIAAEIGEARSSVAIKKVTDGELDVAFTSRGVRPADLDEASKRGRGLHMVVVAAEAVAVIVHPESPLKDISTETLRGIFFTGAIRDWSALTGGAKTGPIKVYAVDPKTSGTGELFVSTIAGEEKAKYVAQAVLVPYSDDSIARVAAEVDAISFSGMGNVNATVKAITINGVAPVEKSILDTSYVLNRKLFAITDGPPKGTAREFVKFLLSETGQSIARAKGVTPIALE